jgi:hypothetical protein
MQAKDNTVISGGIQYKATGRDGSSAATAVTCFLRSAPTRSHDTARARENNLSAAGHTLHFAREQHCVGLLAECYAFNLRREAPHGPASRVARQQWQPKKK